jgi:hypothetical protein
MGVVAEGVAAEERGRGGGGGEGALASSQLWNAVIGGRHRGASASGARVAARVAASLPLSPPSLPSSPSPSSPPAPWAPSASGG